MTEELVKEAGEYCANNCGDCYGCHKKYRKNKNCEKIKSMIKTYLASAEPREKEIKSLGERCLQLQEDKGNLTDKVRELEEKLANADYQLEGRDNEIAKLEAQIGKMKVKWHDLEKDPNDLPKNCKTMCICLGDFGSKYQPVPQVCIGYCDSLGWSDYMGSSLYSTVRYWCELPK